MKICWWSNSGHRNAVAVYATGAVWERNSRELKTDISFITNKGVCEYDYDYSSPSSYPSDSRSSYHLSDSKGRDSYTP